MEHALCDSHIRLYLPLGQNSCESWDSPVKIKKQFSSNVYLDKTLTNQRIQTSLICFSLSTYTLPVNGLFLSVLCIHTWSAVPRHTAFKMTLIDLFCPALLLCSLCESPWARAGAVQSFDVPLVHGGTGMEFKFVRSTS